MRRLVIILYACLAAPLWAQERDLMAGHAAFGAGRYGEALRLYQEARGRGVRLGSAEDWLPELIETVERRRELGAIAPADTQHLGVIVVTAINTVRPGGAVRRRDDVTPAQREAWRTRLGVLRQVVEAFSGGRFTLAFTEIEAEATLDEGAALQAWNPDHLALDAWFQQNEGEHDSYLTLSSTISPNVGLARRYPYFAGVLYGPHRGMLAVRTDTDFTFLLHEYFHTIEWSAGIEPAHAYRSTDRHRVPEWRGQTEFDYYRWRFATAVPPNWSRLLHRRRWRSMPDRDSAVARIRAAYREVSDADRRAGRDLVQQAAQAGRDTARARQLFARALELSPYAEFALNAVNDNAAWRRPEWSERLALVREATAFVALDSVPRHDALIGAWRPPLATSGVEMEWDATAAIRAGGEHVVTLWYTRGWHAARIAWVALLEDGREVSRDAHPGSSGTRRDSIAYRLPLPAHRAGARYTVRARLSGANGTDSNGLVLIRRP